jgi:DNA invertase Pin-like site-specific DNA recombinase
MSQPVPAVIYAAKSTEDKHGSIPTQLEDCRALAKREGWTVVGEYSDEGFSAYSGNRGPDLEAAKTHAARAAKETGTKAILVAQHSDRFARGAGDEPGAADHLAEVWFVMRRQNVELWTLRGHLDGIYAFMEGERNNMDSERKSEAVTDGKRRQLQRGERLGGPVPEGYALRVERDAADRVVDRHYSPDPNRGPLIVHIFELASEGYADAVIARKLNQEGHRTLNDKPWTRRRIQSTVCNAFYAGMVVQQFEGGKKKGVRRLDKPVVVQGRHPPLVDPAVFDRIQSLRVSRDRSRKGRKHEGRPVGRYALAKLAVCGRCGDRMYAVTSPYRRKDGTRARHYVCANYRDATGACDQPKMRADLVDRAMIAHLDSFFLDFDAWTEQATSARRSERNALTPQLEAARERAKKLGRAESKAADKLADALASDNDLADTYAEAKRRAAQDRTQAEAAVSDLEQAVTELDEDVPADALLDFWNDLAKSVRGVTDVNSPLEKVNAHLRTIFDRVLLDNVDEDEGVVAALPVLRPEVVDQYGSGNLRVLTADGYAVTDQPAPDGSPLLVLASGGERVAPPVRQLLINQEPDSQE